MRRKILFRGKVKDIDLETCSEDGEIEYVEKKFKYK